MNHSKQLQTALLNSIFSNNTRSDSILGLTREDRGLKIYRANLRATATQALHISFPTVSELIGPELLNYACEKLLVSHPPWHGDWAKWGAQFAGILEEIEALEEYPFIPDCARLDYLCHQKVRAADYIFNHKSLALLESTDPDNIKVNLSPSLTTMVSDFAIGEIRLAHKHKGESRKQLLLDVVEKKNEGKNHYMCFRNNYEVYVQNVSAVEYQWLNLLMENTLGDALEKIDLEMFSFDEWLPNSINNNLIYNFQKTL